MPDSLKVTYYSGPNTYNEWVCPDHPKWVGAKGHKWARRRLTAEIPISVKLLYENNELLRKPTHVQIKHGKFVEVVNAKF